MGGVRWLWIMPCLLLLGASAAAGAPTPTRVQFTTAGDYSTSSEAAQVLQAAGDSGSDLHLALGDLSYGPTGQEQAWCEFVTARVGAGFPFELVAGNHESDGENGNINDFAACLPNQLPGAVGTYGRQYYVDVPQDDPLVRFVMISPALSFPDGTWSYPAGSPRYQWTAAAIDGARESSIPWTVVSMHKPCLSVGQYSCDVGKDLVNLLVQKKVDLVLSGHEHIYARSKQIGLRAGCPVLVPGTYDADCVVDADSDLRAGAGTVFQIVGTGGTSLRNVGAEDPESSYFAASSGANLQPSHGFGDVEVTPDSLTARFTPVGGGAFTDAFTLTRPTGVGEPPTADFSTTAEETLVSFDATGSTDPENTELSYDWDFADGEVGSGRQVQHDYATAGSYPVTLTVTDQDGMTDSVTKSVDVVSAPGQQPLASDDFERTATRSWGTADVGGAWTASTGAGVASVSGGLGRLALLAAGRTVQSTLNGVSTDAVDITFQMSLDKLPAGNGGRVHQAVLLRRVNGAEYRAIIQLRADRTVTGEVARKNTTGTLTLIGNRVTVPGIAYAAGAVLNVRAQAVGVSPTQLRLKVWPAGSPEPPTWLVSGTDSTAGLQTSGSVGLSPYLSSTATNAPIETRVDVFRAVVP